MSARALAATVVTGVFWIVVWGVVTAWRNVSQVLDSPTPELFTSDSWS